MDSCKPPLPGQSLEQASAQLREHAREACALLKTLANEDRLMLLCQLASGRRNVGELEAATGISQPTLSQQLSVLRQEGLVAAEKEGKYVYYRLVDAKAMRVMGTLWEIFCAPGASPSSP
jgi:DNA-binding transcriptional ArsR family regulator